MRAEVRGENRTRNRGVSVESHIAEASNVDELRVENMRIGEPSIVFMIKLGCSPTRNSRRVW